MQQKLDQEYSSHFEEGSNFELLETKILGIISEIGELNNEIPFHKYWKKNHKRDNKKILEEGADVISYVLSIANQLDIKLRYQEERADEYSIAKKAIMKLYTSAVNLYTGIEHDFSRELLSYIVQDLLNGILSFLHFAGFTFEEIEAAYITKNQKNYSRILSGTY